MKTKHIALFALLLGTAVTAACGDDSSTGGGGTGAAGGQGVGGNGGEPSTGGSEVGGDPSSGGGGGTVEPTVEAAVVFDASAFELPEGLVLHGNEVVLGFALTGGVDAFSLRDFERSGYANAPPSPPNTAFMTGVTFDASDNLYAAYVSFTADAAPGVYRAGPDGGALTLWASDPEMVFPNGFAWDSDGLLYVTDSAAGAVFVIDSDGNVDLWASDPIFQGDLEACGPHGDISVGANGIAFDGAGFYVASSDKASLLYLPLEADGTAGALQTLVDQDCEAIGGIDGITLDADGSIVGAVNRANKLVRILEDGSVSTIAEGAPLDFPASLEFDGDGTLYVTSFALGALLAGGEPHPALVTVKF